MRLHVTSAVLLLAILQVSASSLAQPYITYHKKNATLAEVFKAIKAQTDYTVFYSAKKVDDAKKINAQFTQTDLKEVLASCLKDQQLTFTINKKTIIIQKKEASVMEQLWDFIATPESPASQQNTVKGRVVDSLGNPLPGASVRVIDPFGQRTDLETLTNTDGYFELKNLMPGSVLQISYVGYTTQKINASAQVGTIVLEADASQLEAVQVVLNTGYQTLPKERATGAFGIIDAEQLEKPTINIAQRLIGATAGVQADLDVDGNPSFEIRGQTSLYADAAPLVVVDGFAIQGGFNTINPNDVESITILKDAAAASIWGARAGNGVIVIVTKKGSKGRDLKVDFQAFTQIGSKFDLAYVNPLASSSETIDYELMSFNKWSARENSGAFQSNYGKQWSLGTTAISEHYLGYITEAERDAILNRLRTLDNRQQIKDELLANPSNQQYNLTLQGSTPKMQNIFSLLYRKDQSNFKETEGQHYMLNYRTSSTIFKWLDFKASAMLQYNDRDHSGASLGDIQDLSPYEMLRNEDGSFTNISQYYWPIMERFVPMELFPYADWTYNPISEIYNRQLNSKDLNTRLMGGFTFKPLKGLTYETSVQYELFNTFNRNLYDENTFYVRSRVNTATTWDQTTNDMTLNLPKGSILTQSRSKVEAWILRNQANYNRAFGDRHEINFVAGSEISNFVTEGFNHPTTYGYNDETLTLGSFPNGPGGTFFPIKNWLGSNQTFSYTNSFTYRTERFFSLFANAAYTFNRKYTLSGSIRTDASNMITDDPSYRYAPLWSVGGRWQIEQEPFMDNVDWVDQLGLRLTYGYNGNVDRSTAFMPLVNMNTTPNIYIDAFTAGISSYGNPTLRWEKTGTWNVGLDFSLFSGSVFGKVDVYNKYGKDLIAQLSIPAVNGTTSQKLNNAEMRNRGIELELGTVLPIKGNDIVWRGNMSFSYNKNKITKLFVANYAASNLYPGGTGAYVEGYDANSMWMFEYAGVHDKQPMIKGADGALYDFGAWTPGDGRDFMLNMGTKVAPYTLGLINSFKIYDFDLSVIITGKLGHVFRKMPFNYPPTWTSRVLPNNKLSEVLNGDPSQIVPLPLNDIEDRYYFWDRFHPYLSYNAASASHLRLQEVNLTYSLPTRQWSLLQGSRLMVYAQGNDLATVLFNDAHEDPEYPLGTMNPRPRFTVGLKVGF